MLTRIQQGALIPATLTMKGQGESITFNITYRNTPQSVLTATVTEQGVNASLLLIVESWETEYPLTDVGIAEAEDERPGFIMGVIAGYHEARRVEKVKN